MHPRWTTADLDVFGLHVGVSLRPSYCRPICRRRAWMTGCGTSLRTWLLVGWGMGRSGNPWHRGLVPSWSDVARRTGACAALFRWGGRGEHMPLRASLAERKLWVNPGKRRGLRRNLRCTGHTVYLVPRVDPCMRGVFITILVAFIALIGGPVYARGVHNRGISLGCGLRWTRVCAGCSTTSRLTLDSRPVDPCMRGVFSTSSPAWSGRGGGPVYA